MMTDLYNLLITIEKIWLTLIASYLLTTFILGYIFIVKYRLLEDFRSDSLKTRLEIILTLSVSVIPVIQWGAIVMVWAISLLTFITRKIYEYYSSKSKY